MEKLFNELGLSLVRAGSWVGVSHEVEFPDGTETRGLGWRKFRVGEIDSAYVRIWVWKRVLVIAGKRPFIKLRPKPKPALKIILGLEIHPTQPQ